MAGRLAQALPLRRLCASDCHGITLEWGRGHCNALCSGLVWRHQSSVLRLDTTAQVDTPERVVLRYRLAGPGRRAAAYVIDGMCRGAILAVIAVIAASVAAVVPGGYGIGTGGLLLGLFFLEWGYGVLFEWLMAGRTPGKLALGIRVVREDGAPGRFSDFLLRNLLRTADFLPGFFAVGLVCMLLDSRFRRLGDLVGGTVVVVEDSERMLDTVAIEPPVTEEERHGLPVALALTVEERRVLEVYVRRLPRLSRERAEELAGLYGPALQDRTGWRAETWTRTLVLAYARAMGRER